MRIDHRMIFDITYYVFLLYYNNQSNKYHMHVSWIIKPVKKFLNERQGTPVFFLRSRNNIIDRFVSKCGIRMCCPGTWIQDHSICILQSWRTSDVRRYLWTHSTKGLWICNKSIDNMCCCCVTIMARAVHNSAHATTADTVLTWHVHNC